MAKELKAASLVSIRMKVCGLLSGTLMPHSWNCLFLLFLLHYLTEPEYTHWGDWLILQAGNSEIRSKVFSGWLGCQCLVGEHWFRQHFCSTKSGALVSLANIYKLKNSQHYRCQLHSNHVPVKCLGKCIRITGLKMGNTWIFAWEHINEQQWCLQHLRIPLYCQEPVNVLDVLFLIKNCVIMSPLRKMLGILCLHHQFTDSYSDKLKTSAKRQN